MILQKNIPAMATQLLHFMYTGGPENCIFKIYCSEKVILVSRIGKMVMIKGNQPTVLAFLQGKIICKVGTGTKSSL